MEGGFDVAGMRLGVIVQPVGVFGVVRSLDLFFLMMVPAWFLSGNEFALGSLAAFAPETISFGIAITVGSPDSQTVVGICVHFRIVPFGKITTLQISADAILEENFAHQEIR